MNADEQQKIYSLLQQCSSKEAEDGFLSSMMKQENAKTQKSNLKRPRLNIWKYTVRYQSSIDISMCKKCFAMLFQVSKSKMIQTAKFE